MNQAKNRVRRELRKQIRSVGRFEQPLEALLALDRAVVELSMMLYQLPRRERRVMRKQNRRLHAAVREQLPQLLSRAAASGRS